MYLASVIGKGNIAAKIVTDSTSMNNQRITTFELRYPRFIHAELMTHRVFSRNASSSRAIPVKKIIASIEKYFAHPIHWGKNKPGMQAAEELADGNEIWQRAGKSAIEFSKEMDKVGYHKQIVNRITEPFQFINVVVTSTEWENWYNLRDHKDAQPEIAELAKIMKEISLVSTPKQLNVSEWHLPYITKADTKKNGNRLCVKASAARCARVSYMNHDSSVPTMDDDLALYNMLATRPFTDTHKGLYLGEDDPMHLSPLEHQAKPLAYLSGPDIDEWDRGTTHMDKYQNLWSGNFKGWCQHRQLL